jgi:Ca2+-binding EF-hand superfamily protein
MLLSTAQLQDFFNLFDIDQKGYIPTTEIETLLRGVGFSDLSSEELQAMIKAMDIDCNKMISFAEFSRMVRRKLPADLSSEEVWQSFRLLSSDGTRITGKELLNVAHNHDSSIPSRVLLQVLEDANGEISFDKWKNIVDAASTKIRVFSKQ